MIYFKKSLEKQLEDQGVLGEEIICVNGKNVVREIKGLDNVCLLRIREGKNYDMFTVTNLRIECKKTNKTLYIPEILHYTVGVAQCKSGLRSKIAARGVKSYKTVAFARLLKGIEYFNTKDSISSTRDIDDIVKVLDSYMSNWETHHVREIFYETHTFLQLLSREKHNDKGKKSHHLTFEIITESDYTEFYKKITTPYNGC